MQKNTPSLPTLLLSSYYQNSTPFFVFAIRNLSKNQGLGWNKPPFLNTIVLLYKFYLWHMLPNSRKPPIHQVVLLTPKVGSVFIYPSQCTFMASFTTEINQLFQTREFLKQTVFWLDSRVGLNSVFLYHSKLFPMLKHSAMAPSHSLLVTVAIHIECQIRFYRLFFEEEIC